MADHAGKSIIEELWEQADAQYAKLRELHEETDGYTADRLMSMFEDGMSKDSAEETSAEVVAYLQTQGKVSALAFAIGTVLFMYDDPKTRIDKVRPMLAERWEDNNPDEEDDGE